MGDIADTKKSLGADEQFLMMLKEKCSMTDGEWEERQKTRQLEMEACSKALAVLSSDDAHDLFTRLLSIQQERRCRRCDGHDPTNHQRRQGHGGRGHSVRGRCAESLRRFRQGYQWQHRGQIQRYCKQV